MSAAEWQDFRSRFMQLVNDEQEVVQVTGRPTLYLDACGFYESPQAPEVGVWKLSGMSEDFRAQFRALAHRAGLALGCPKETVPDAFWLHRLYLDLRANKSEYLFEPSDQQGGIQRVCKASATFCSRLETLPAEDTVNETRESFLRPILVQKGLSVRAWATKAGVDFHTADDYLKSKSKPYPDTLKNLADALDIEIAKLPD
jgi:hypothetical protein